MKVHVCWLMQMGTFIECGLVSISRNNIVLILIGAMPLLEFCYEYRHTLFYCASQILPFFVCVCTLKARPSASNRSIVTLYWCTGVRGSEFKSAISLRYAYTGHVSNWWKQSFRVWVLRANFRSGSQCCDQTLARGICVQLVKCIRKEKRKCGSTEMFNIYPQWKVSCLKIIWISKLNSDIDSKIPKVDKTPLIWKECKKCLQIQVLT